MTLARDHGPLGLDPDTADTLRSMVRYIRDDRRIARHLDIAEVFVRRARARLPQCHPCSGRNAA